MNSRCIHCRKPYKYAAAYQNHIEKEHSGLLNVISQPPTTRLSSSTRQDVATLGPGYPLDDDGFILQDDNMAEGERQNNGSPDIESDYTEDEQDGNKVTRGPHQTEKGITMVVTELFPGAGRPLEAIEASGVLDAPSPDWNPWEPFKTSTEFKLAKWFIDSHIPMSKINDYFNFGLSTAKTSSFQSAHSLRQQIQKMDPSMGEISWKRASVSVRSGHATWYYRNPLSIIRFLLYQRSFVEDLVYSPIKEFNAEGDRVYSEMHTGTWWWEAQVSRCIAAL